LYAPKHSSRSSCVINSSSRLGVFGLLHDDQGRVTLTVFERFVCRLNRKVEVDRRLLGGKAFGSHMPQNTDWPSVGGP